MVFPVHNESFIIEQTLCNYIAEFQGRVPDFEVIVAEDGSTDDTKAVLERLAEELPIELYLSNDRKGYQQAVIDAITRATKPWVFVVDFDYQFAVVELLEAGALPQDRRHHPRDQMPPERPVFGSGSPGASTSCCASSSRSPTATWTRDSG